MLCGSGQLFSPYPRHVFSLKKETLSLSHAHRIHFNITFDALACEDAHVHSMDTHGNQVYDHAATVIKTPLHLDGTRIVGRNQSYSEKIATLIRNDDPPKNMTQGEGCNLAGYLHSYRVLGNFHIAMGRAHRRAGRHIHEFHPSDRPNFHVSHTIHYLHLDDHNADSGEQQVHPKGVLDGTRAFVTVHNGTTGLFQYFLTIIPTHRDFKESNRYILNQTKFTPLYNTTTTTTTKMGQQQSPTGILPGVFFILEMNPLSELVEQEHFGVGNVLRISLLTVGLFVLIIWLDEVFFGARRRLMESKTTRARMLVVV